MPKAYFDSLVEAREFAKEKQQQGYWVKPTCKCLRVPVNPELEAIADFPTAKKDIYEVVYKDKPKSLRVIPRS